MKDDISINQTMNGINTTLQAEAKVERFQWVWGPFNFERLVIISLILQFILFFGAPFRKSTAKGLVLGLVWSAYLLADWVSYYSIGLVLNGESGSDPNHLHILWGTLLLGHMSSPDTISVLDMEDHNLWSRTALKFGIVACSIARITRKTFSHMLHRSPATLHRSMHKTHEEVHMLYYMPTVLLFVVGVAKSLERIATLVFNRTVVFQDRVVRQINANPSNVKLVEGAVLVKELDFCSKRIIRNRENMSQIDILKDAYQFYHLFKGCYVDLKFELKNGDPCIKECFLDRTVEEAFEVIEIELNLMYDIFYTKASMFQKLVACIMCYLVVIAEVVALACLASAQLKDVGHGFDVPITYFLVLGALSMDIIATLQIIFSIRIIMLAHDDRFRAWLHKTLGMPLQQSNDNDDDDFSIRGWLLNKLLKIRRRTWGKQSSRKETSYLQLVKRMLFRRWSESILQFNFIDYCLRKQIVMWKRVFHIPGVKERIYRAKYVSQKWFTDSLRDFIFEELKSKVKPLQPWEADQRHQSDDGWLIQNLDPVFFGFYEIWVSKLELDESLLVWHIATDFCWTSSDDTNIHNDEWQRYQWSKTLSDYMLYLLLLTPKMLKKPEVELMGKIRFAGAYDKAKPILTRSNELPREDRLRLYVEACDEIKRNLQSVDENDGMVYKAYQLAQQLENINNKWITISKVCVLLLCRTAAESKPRAHTRTLTRGGELLTIVWLLMNHLGIDSWDKELKIPCNSPPCWLKPSQVRDSGADPSLPQH